ncbi:unnamed protein product [Closterium sp. Yama58-4]|nr:unnamed protein product [Closterium sp. Yama58-4]
MSSVEKLIPENGFSAARSLSLGRAASEQAGSPRLLSCHRRLPRMHLARVLSATCRNAVKQRGTLAVGPSLPVALQQQQLRQQSGQPSGQPSGQQSGLADFFEQGRTPDAPVTTGRGWQAWELRHKSFEDLHALWYVLLKEKNLLYSQKQMLQSQGRRMVQPHRIRLVKASMCRIKQVLTERALAVEDPDKRCRRSDASLLLRSASRVAPSLVAVSSFPAPFPRYPRFAFPPLLPVQPPCSLRLVRAQGERSMAAQRAPPTFRLRAYYGIDFPGKVAVLVAQSLLSFALSATLFGRYAAAVALVRRLWPLLPAQIASFLVGFSAAFALLLAFAYSLTLSANLRTSLLLRPRLARHMLALVPAWQPVRTALDLGSGRGVLLASLGLQLLECGGEGRAIGGSSGKHVRHRRADKAKAGHPGRNPAGATSPSPAAPAVPASGLAAISAPAVGSMAGALRAAAREGVGALVTCKTGAFDRLPFPDAYFDVVVSALRLHAIASVLEDTDPQAAERERQRVLQQVVRVLKPGGRVVVWDVMHVPAYAEYFSS